MSKTIGINSNYNLDLNAGLSQVLADGNKTYLYGNGRIGEDTGAEWVYFASDADH